MFKGYNYDAVATDANLDAADVDDTGTYSAAIAMEGALGVLLQVHATFPDPATDNAQVEVYESFDGTNYVIDSSYNLTITKSAGATVIGRIRVTSISPYIKALVKSAGATDTPTITLKTAKYREVSTG